MKTSKEWAEHWRRWHEIQKGNEEFAGMTDSHFEQFATLIQEDALMEASDRVHTALDKLMDEWRTTP